MTEPDLAVAIVSWNVRDLLLECLRSVREAMDGAGLSGEIWVVDNASQDGSVEALLERFPGVRLIASPLNLWFGGGQNLALRAMGFTEVPVAPPVRVTEEGVEIGTARFAVPCMARLPRYVLVLNPDTLVHRDALRSMVRFMDRSPEAGVCGPRLSYPDGSFQHAAYRFPSLAQTYLEFWPVNWRLTDSMLNGRYGRRLYEGGQPFPIDHPLGAAMFFRREVIQETGGFDLDYEMYVEEIDWCLRVKRAGWKITCLPEAEMVHYAGQSTRQVRSQMIVALWRSRYVLFDKHYSALYRLLVRRIIRAGMRAEIRRAQEACRRGEMEEPEARALVDAYRQVIEL